MGHSARKKAWAHVDDTCPYVDDAFYDLHNAIKSLSLEDFSKGMLEKLLDECSDKVKIQTTRLRDALVLAYEEMEEALEAQEEEYEGRISLLEKQLEEK